MGEVKKKRTDSYLRFETNDNLFFVRKYFLFLLNYISSYKNEIQDSDFLEDFNHIMSIEEIEDIVKYCTTAKIRNDISKLRSRNRKVDFESDDTSYIITGLWNYRKTSYKLKKKLKEYVERYISEIDSIIEETPNYRNLYEERFGELKAEFSLSDLEVDLILILVMIEVDAINASDLKSYNKNGLIQRISSLLGVPLSKITELYSADEKLRKFGLLDEDCDLSRGVTLYLSGMSDQPLISSYYRQLKEETLPWEYFSDITATHGIILETLIKSAAMGKKKGLNILLYGEPGTGKTSFANALAERCGLNAYSIAQNTIDKKSDSSTSFRFAAIQVCENRVDSEKSLIIIDESDEMLRGKAQGLFGDFMAKAGDKGVINTVLDKNKAPCIWIANLKQSELDSSTARRFDYAIKFNPLTLEQRTGVWKNSMLKHGLDNIPEETLKVFAEKYRISAGGIDMAMSNLQTLMGSEEFKNRKIDEVLETLLKPHCELMDIQSNEKKYNIASDYSLEGLNVKGDIQPFNIVKAAEKFRKKLEESISGTAIDSPRMNILLYGPPGTGKTEFVKYLASKLDCNISVKMGSDLLDKYVGGTEEKIKTAFREAEKDGSILFIDEADGLFHSRGMAKNSWEITQVNELLHQMENFRGILVCATNFKQNLDKATARRFLFKLEFRHLDSEGNLIFYERMLANLAKGKLTETEKNRLAGLTELTPGEFRNVRQSFYYLEDGAITHSMLINRLEDEIEAKQERKVNKIGFSNCA